MAKFSDRIGITQPTIELQLAGMNDSLRNSLWNMMIDALHNHIILWYNPMKILFTEYFKQPIDDLPYEGECRPLLRSIFYKLEWSEV